MVNSDLRSRILKNSTLDTTAILADSFLFKPRDMIVTTVPMVNVALSGRIDGGMQPGLLQIAGESKHFKTAFGLLLVTTFLKTYPDGIVIFYDSEFGTPKSYFQSFNIDPQYVVHCPITSVEELKFDIVAQLKGITNKDRVMILIDSLGNVPSTKEVTDAEDQKSAADMTRAKEIKSLFRIIYAKIILKNIHFVAINHVYSSMDLYARPIVSGGTGPKYNSNDIWIITRQQEKQGTRLTGFNFDINIEKSRLVREKTKIPITVTFEKGIHQYSGLFDVAIEFGIIRQGGAWYEIPHGTKKYRRDELENDAGFWNEMFATTELKNFILNKYALPDKLIVNEELEDEDISVQCDS